MTGPITKLYESLRATNEYLLYLSSATVEERRRYTHLSLSRLQRRVESALADVEMLVPGQHHKLLAAGDIYAETYANFWGHGLGDGK